MKRYLYYLLGMNILVLGITCNTLSDLGVGAFSTLPYAVSFLTFLTFGQANIVFYLIFVCIQMILERKISMKFILEIPFSFIWFFGRFISIHNTYNKFESLYTNPCVINREYVLCNRCVFYD